MEELREDELLAEEAQDEAPQQTEFTMKPRQRRSRKVSPVSVFLGKIVAYFASIGKDVKWYYDIRLWSPLILLLLILALVLPGRGKKQEAQEIPVETVEVQSSTETTPPTEPVIPEAEALARLADSVGAGRSDNVKTIIMWVAVNRSEDRANGYGQSLLEEIARPNQWQGYDENTVYSASTYEIAKEVLETVENGGLRPLDNDMLWLVLNDDGSVTVRDQFTAKGNQKWKEKTVK